MNLYNNGFQEDEFTEEEISLANGFCDACDRGVIRSYDEDQYDVIISHLMFSQKADYLKKAIEQARKEFHSTTISVPLPTRLIIRTSI